MYKASVKATKMQRLLVCNHDCMLTMSPSVINTRIAPTDVRMTPRPRATNNCCCKACRNPSLVASISFVASARIILMALWLPAFPPAPTYPKYSQLTIRRHENHVFHVCSSPTVYPRMPVHWKGVLDCSSLVLLNQPH